MLHRRGGALLALAIGSISRRSSGSSRYMPYGAFN
jgi:hypothetical protein